MLFRSGDPSPVAPVTSILSTSDDGDTAHVPAREDMKGRWKHPIKGMGWYKDTKKAFAALPDD